MNKNILMHHGKIDTNDRAKRFNQSGLVVWFTGLSGSGKSTLSVDLEKRLFDAGKLVYRLDGDNIRHGLNEDLGFSEADRQENIRRAAQVANLFQDAGFIVLASFISPHQSMRDYAKQVIGEDHFLEVYVKASLETCQKRDPKGHYKKAKQGEIKLFTGISSNYEVPTKPDIILDTEKLTPNELLSQLMMRILQ